MIDPTTCSMRSRARSEPGHGTASTVRAFVLVESAGPWGADALLDSRLPAHVLAHLRQLGSGVRPLLIRRHGRTDNVRVRVFVAYADPHHPWLETAELDAPEQVLDISFDQVANGGSARLDRSDGPVFLACTHGRHDRCCAERGRPLAAALNRSHPAQSWEVSHIGGDRFAANLLVLPDGLYYGRVEADEAAELADRHRAGHLDLTHLRGRSGYGFAVQAAEWFLRTELQETGLRALRLEQRTTRDVLTTAIFVIRARRWRVQVIRTEGPGELLTCGAARRSPVPRYEVVSIERGEAT